MSTWSSEILSGVDEVFFKSCLPGIIQIYGDNAQAVLVNKKREILCAAAELGQGRVVVFAHDMFINNFNDPLSPNKQFNENLKRWLTKGINMGNDVPTFQTFMGNFENLPSSCKILRWNGFDNPGETSLKQLTSWIEGGGGFVCGVCPWGFVQLTGIHVDKMPLNFIFQKIDVAYAGQSMFHVDVQGSDKVSVENLQALAQEPQKQPVQKQSTVNPRENEEKRVRTRQPNWRSEILDGVRDVYFKSCVMGVLFVYGEKAQAVLANKQGEVMCAAAELGRGRIIVFSHDMFVNNFNTVDSPNRKFNGNIRRWITKGTDKGQEIPEYQSYMKNFNALPPQCKVLSWNGFDSPGEAGLLRLLDWVENGGGLICGVCPWGFVQITGISVDKMPLNIIFQKIGVAYAGEKTYTPDVQGSDKISISDNTAEFAKPQDLFAELSNHPEKVGRLGGLLGGVCHLPDELFNYYSPGVREMICKISKGNNYVPCKSNPVKESSCKNAASIMCEVMVRDGLNGNPVVAAGIEEFPGNFSKAPPVQTIKVNISSKVSKFHATGCYLPAGIVTEVSWTPTKKPWNIIVGLHRDELNMSHDVFRRWPKVSLKKEMQSDKKDKCGTPMKLCNPFGGLIYLESPDIPDKIDVVFTNVVPSPVFTYKTAGIWESSERHKPGLWCDIVGTNISFTLPSSSIRDLPDPTPVMKVWDSVVAAHTDLLGRDASNGRGEWVVTDEQPSAGYMHSGYPIVTHLDVADSKKIDDDCFLLNKDHLLMKGKGKGCWGMFHELGHNFQDYMWTWDATVEVTVNIFTLHAMEVICGVKPWDHKWLRDQFNNASKYLKEGAKFEAWCSDPGIALLVYAQLARDFGWKAYKAVFRTYDKMPQGKRPNTDQEKIDTWVETFSLQTKRNLCPLFEFWGWPISQSVTSKVEKFPFYLPDDETTKEYAPQRASKVTKKYKG